MSMKFMIAAAAVMAVVAGPALAGDQDLETELRDSGRYVAVPLASAPRGRQVEAPPWSFACVTDHGPRPCREPMWVYD